MSNRLCKLTEYVLDAGPGQSTFVRGSCTDKNWGGSCPNFCVTPKNGDTLSGAMGLAQCVGNSVDQYYCLDRAVDTFTFSVHNPSLASSMVCTSFSNQVYFQGTPTTVTIIGVATTSTPATTVATTTSTTNSLSTTSTQVTAQITSSISSPLETGQSSSGPSLGVAVGAGVGVPMGIIAISVVAYILWKHRRSKKREMQHETAQLQPPNPDHLEHHSKYEVEKQQHGLVSFSQPVEIGRQSPPHELSAHDHDS
ncbi:uncharacterized protein PV09_04625 [Verruconis gallopava]|uniref:Mid2 domain-containing protein n=1 Tax=Verruconis gallopava TaxID=253628 RepID=A0A0D2AD03_9PEZI|nr:uncharacterized protein PV09_04625 [Verruconis gallopava]KIW04335.1 hypothetical protein PV09_04625 [Verruconis gallopava]